MNGSILSSLRKLSLNPEKTVISTSKKKSQQRALSPWMRKRGESIDKKIINQHFDQNIQMEESLLLKDRLLNDGGHVTVVNNGNNISGTGDVQNQKLNEFLRKIQFTKRRTFSDVEGINNNNKIKTTHSTIVYRSNLNNNINNNNNQVESNRYGSVSLKNQQKQNNNKNQPYNIHNHVHHHELIIYPAHTCDISGKGNENHGGMIKFVYGKQKSSRTLSLSTQYFSDPFGKSQKSGFKGYKRQTKEKDNEKDKEKSVKYQNKNQIYVPIHVNEGKFIVQNLKMNDIKVGWRKNNVNVDKNIRIGSRGGQKKIDMIEESLVDDCVNKSSQQLNNMLNYYLPTSPTYATPSPKAVKYLKQKQKKSYRIKTSDQIEKSTSNMLETKFTSITYRPSQQQKKKGHNRYKTEQFDEDFLFKTFSQYKKSGLNSTNLSTMLKLKFFNNRTFKQNINKIIQQSKSTQ